jgi:hypothetical protein
MSRTANRSWTPRRNGFEAFFIVERCLDTWFVARDSNEKCCGYETIAKSGIRIGAPNFDSNRFSKSIHPEEVFLRESMRESLVSLGPYDGPLHLAADHKNGLA